MFTNSKLVICAENSVEFTHLEISKTRMGAYERGAILCLSPVLFFMLSSVWTESKFGCLFISKKRS